MKTPFHEPQGFQYRRAVAPREFWDRPGQYSGVSRAAIDNHYPDCLRPKSTPELGNTTVTGARRLGNGRNLPGNTDSLRFEHQVPAHWEDLEVCRQILLRTFTACDETRFDNIACAISCVLAAVRPLHLPELKDAMTIYFEAQERSAITSGMPVQDFLAWLQLSETPFNIGQDLQVTFSHDAMPYFLRVFTIRGIDNSDRTLAMICFQRVQQLRKSTTRNLVDQGVTALSDYASRFWKHHCQIAKGTDADTSGIDTTRLREPHRHYRESATNFGPSNQRKRCEDINYRLEQLQLDDSWVHIQ